MTMIYDPIPFVKLLLWGYRCDRWKLQHTVSTGKYFCCKQYKTQ